MLRRLLLPWALCLPILHAAEPAATPAATPAEGAWHGEGQLGFNATSGNTDSENLNAILGLSREANNWKHAVALEVFRAETDGETSVDLLEIRGKSEYGFGETSYFYGQLRYEEDAFSGYDHQTSVTFGAGSRLLETDRHRLDVSAGPGLRYAKNSESGDTEDEAIVGANLSYEYTLSEFSTLTARLLLEAGEENTYSESETALKTRIAGALSAKLSYLVKHNSTVPPGIDDTDRFVTVSLVYAF